MNHWETIYASKADDELSWHQQQSATSYDLIRQVAKPGSGVIDVGGGSSSLAGKLAVEGYSPVSVVDISKSALERAQNRLAPSIRTKVDWRVADILNRPDLPVYDVWHDRAVFHFLIESQEQDRYRALAERTVAPEGFLIMSTFGSDGPERCSGLPVRRYDPDSLAEQFQRSFRLRTSAHEVHLTPWGAAQPFIYVVMERR